MVEAEDNHMAHSIAEEVAAAIQKYLGVKEA
jgi:hypothetical protein